MADAARQASRERELAGQRIPALVATAVGLVTLAWPILSRVALDALNTVAADKVPWVENRAYAHFVRMKSAPKAFGASGEVAFQESKRSKGTQTTSLMNRPPPHG